MAGIGFAGSYAAVRELAIKKGFGTFSYVFPIGIDAGICVLLALDLLLTWIRIPFPLLRQTAWLLTAATIAFNGAAAWPDPLGVGMHAVIPVLFVVSVEAARHAIGRIADITADQHMEGVRLTRWLLSPLPTFLLWRRMRLWELPSYEQVIKLEQERLVYQARLRSRFGRAWRRKAPVESLMPLRLARYGVPLAETTPPGLAAAGIEAPHLFPVEQPASPPALETAADPVKHPAARRHPDTKALQTAPSAESAPASDTRSGPQVNAARQHPHTTWDYDADRQPPATLTAVDRYYLAWADLQKQHRDAAHTSTPAAQQLSTYLATQGMHGRDGRPLSPATLRRYLLPFRLYSVWAQYRQHTPNPPLETIAQQCTTHGITAQYNKPITAAYLTQHATDFERRWHALARHRIHHQQ
ncbi:DUF2637 domain-containing protein [Streptomyces sp. NPDC001604]|uniref:DUF2637 domain-containing protein n=1 Tax=Streptomyces sp. NPDC001604 TaxID=3364593 RepID=UPI0036CBB58C